jgi:hypothetical protein
MGVTGTDFWCQIAAINDWGDAARQGEAAGHP